MLKILKTELEKLKLKNKQDEIKIFNLEKQIEQAEWNKLAKVSPAEEWVYKNLVPCPVWNIFDRNDVIQAHEAGQKVGAEKEAGIYNYIVYSLSNFIRDDRVKGRGVKEWRDHFERSLKRLKQKPEEKPEIVGKVREYNIYDNHFTVSLTFEKEYFEDFNKLAKYKLTPIQE